MGFRTSDCYASGEMQRRDLLKCSPLAVAATVGNVSAVEAQTEPHGSEGIYNVRNFGAKGDGKAVDQLAACEPVDTIALRRKIAARLLQALHDRRAALLDQSGRQAK